MLQHFFIYYILQTVARPVGLTVRILEAGCVAQLLCGEGRRALERTQDREKRSWQRKKHAMGFVGFKWKLMMENDMYEEAMDGETHDTRNLLDYHVSSCGASW